MRKRRVVAQLPVVDIVVDRIEPEAVDAALQPEPHRLQQRLLHLRIVEVEVRLRGQEIVQVVLLARRSHSQAGPPKIDSQLFGAVPSGFGSAQTYQSALGLLRLARLSTNHGCRSEECDSTWSMMIFRPETVRLGDQRVEILDRAEHRIDGAVVRHVVAHVGHRRLEEWRQPDGVDAERGDVSEAPR